MDIFEVLTAIAKRKTIFTHTGMDENDALLKAELDVSRDFHISLPDIKKLVGHHRRASD